MSRTAHTMRAVTDGHEVGYTARCEKCSATVAGIIAWGATGEEAMLAAQAILDHEAADRGWRCLPNGDRCPRCKTPPGQGA